MNLGELRDKVRLELRDSGGEVGGAPHVDHLNNEAGREFARESRIIRESILLNEVAATAEYAVPVSALDVLRVYEQDRKLDLASPGSLEAWYGSSWRTDAGTPRFYLMPDASTVRLHPIPADSVTDGIRFDVVKDFTELADDSDVPAIPAKYHLALVWYAADLLKPSDDLKVRYQALLQQATSVASRCRFACYHPWERRHLAGKMPALPGKLLTFETQH